MSAYVLTPLGIVGPATRFVVTQFFFVLGRQLYNRPRMRRRVACPRLVQLNRVRLCFFYCIKPSHYLKYKASSGEWLDDGLVLIYCLLHWKDGGQTANWPSPEKKAKNT